LGTAPHVSTLCLPDVTVRDQISAYCKQSKTGGGNGLEMRLTMDTLRTKGYILISKVSSFQRTIFARGWGMDKCPDSRGSTIHQQKINYANSWSKLIHEQVSRFKGFHYTSREDQLCQQL